MRHAWESAEAWGKAQHDTETVVALLGEYAAGLDLEDVSKGGGASDDPRVHATGSSHAGGGVDRHARGVRRARPTRGGLTQRGRAANPNRRQVAVIGTEEPPTLDRECGGPWETGMGRCSGGFAVLHLRHARPPCRSRCGRASPARSSSSEGGCRCDRAPLAERSSPASLARIGLSPRCPSRLVKPAC